MQSAPYLMMIFLPPIYGNLAKESNTPILPPCVMGGIFGSCNSCGYFHDGAPAQTVFLKRQGEVDVILKGSKNNMCCLGSDLDNISHLRLLGWFKAFRVSEAGKILAASVCLGISSAVNGVVEQSGGSAVPWVMLSLGLRTGSIWWDGSEFRLVFLLAVPRRAWVSLAGKKASCLRDSEMF